jgi:hypothetical protein
MTAVIAACLKVCGYGGDHAVDERQSMNLHHTLIHAATAVVKVTGNHRKVSQTYLSNVVAALVAAGFFA